MKKRILILTAVMLLTGCAKGYDPLKKNDKNDNVTIDGELKYCNLEEVKEQRSGITNESYNHLTVPNNLTVSIPNSICNLKIHEDELDMDTAKKLFDEFANEKMSFSISEDNNFPALQTSFDSHGQYFRTYKYGGFSYYTNENTLNRLRVQENEKKYCYFNSSDNNKTIKLASGTITLEEAKTISQKFVDKYCETIGVPPYTPSYYDYSDSLNGIIIYYNDNLDGYGVVDYAINDSTNVPLINKDMFVGNYPQAYSIIYDTDEVEFFVDITGGSKVTERNDEKDKMVSLISALHFVDKNLADYFDCSVLNISLVQCRDKEKSDPFDLYMSQEEYEDYAEDYQTYPCWQIILSDIKIPQNRYVALINCSSGEFGFARIMN